jgi:hypothetical protein
MVGLSITGKKRDVEVGKKRKNRKSQIGGVPEKIFIICVRRILRGVFVRI